MAENQVKQQETASAKRVVRAARPPRKKGPIERLHPWAKTVRTWFFSAAPSAIAAWFVLEAVLAGVLIWFFLFSSYGAPASPIYADF